MKKEKLRQAVNDKIEADAVEFDETKNALQTIYDALNKGQKQKLLKDDEIVALLERYGVDRGE